MSITAGGRGGAGERPPASPCRDPRSAGPTGVGWLSPIQGRKSAPRPRVPRAPSPHAQGPSSESARRTTSGLNSQCNASNSAARSISTGQRLDVADGGRQRLTGAGHFGEIPHEPPPRLGLWLALASDRERLYGRTRIGFGDC